MFQRITFNLEKGVPKRYETLEGRQYLVVPTVMITEGVHAGSQGPMYYSPTELSKNPAVWNHKPIVVYHPTLNGDGISACDPAIVEHQKIGLLFNTEWDGRLKTESWLDVEKVKAVAPVILDSILNDQMVEVSTGLYQDPDMTPGVWNDKPYNGSVRNIMPDHLAVLPDEKGACSIADGAGFLRNADGGTLSYDDIRQQICCLLNDGKSYGDCYVTDLYPKYAIYCEDWSEDKYYKINYKLKAGKVVLDGEKEKVTRTSEASRSIRKSTF
jgi:hypothetical protein